MNAKEAREIIDKQKNHQWIAFELYSEAKGYIEALEGPEVKELIKALEYCSVDPGLLQPQHNRQNAVAMNALGNFRRMTEEATKP